MNNLPRYPEKKAVAGMRNTAKTVPGFSCAQDKPGGPATTMSSGTY
jgi:hypothetical protein